MMMVSLGHRRHLVFSHDPRIQDMDNPEASKKELEKQIAMNLQGKLLFIFSESSLCMA